MFKILLNVALVAVALSSSLLAQSENDRDSYYRPCPDCYGSSPYGSQTLGSKRYSITDSGLGALSSSRYGSTYSRYTNPISNDNFSKYSKSSFGYSKLYDRNKQLMQHRRQLMIFYLQENIRQNEKIIKSIDGIINTLK